MITQTQTINPLIIRGVRSDEELYRATRLMTESRRAGDPLACEWLENYGGTYPHFKREHTRIALLKGELAGALRICTDTIRIGEARLKMGGLSWVSVAPRFRNQHVFSELVAEALGYLSAHRYHVAMVFAPSREYEPLGFKGAIADYRFSIDSARSMILPHTRRIRDVKPGDIGALQRIQSSNAQGISCSLLRERGHFANQWGHFKGAKVMTNSVGRIEGYILLRNGIGRLHIDELEAANHDACMDLLSYAVSVGRDRLMRWATLHAAPVHPVMTTVNLAIAPEAIRLNTKIAGLMKVIDTAETLESMIPEWESRIDRSLLREMDCEVTLIVERVPYRIRVHHGALDIARQSGKNKFSINAGEFSQLLTGYASIDTVWDQERRLIMREGRALLETMFPKRSPYLSVFDRF